MRRLKTYILLIAAATAGGSVASAQAAVAPYRYNVGGALGATGYIGDLNSGNPLKNPGLGLDVRGSYVFDTRWSVTAALSTAGMHGSSDGIANVLPQGESYTFTSHVYDLGIRGEFNFFSYGIGETYKRLSRWTPYMALGAGVGLVRANGITDAAFTMPFALGARYRLNERTNLFGEFCMTKVFNDRVDAAPDINHIKTEFYKNTDWTSRIAVGLTFEFGKRCETCHYVD